MIHYLLMMVNFILVYEIITFYPVMARVGTYLHKQYKSVLFIDG